MGAAVDTTSDTHSGDNGGTSMAVTLAVATTPVHVFTYSWSQVAGDTARERPDVHRKVTRCRSQIYFNPSCSKCRTRAGASRGAPR